MATRSNRRGSETRYFLRFAGTATLLVSGTLVLVLYVLPQRYVLSSGFREGALALPNPSTPFEPVDPTRVAALPPPPVPYGIVQGPAELFWESVMPLLRAGRHDQAIPLFAMYLGEYPDDRDARREYAITLTTAGYGDRAIPVLQALLDVDDDPELRLLLARTLRDEGRVAEAVLHYEVLVEADRDDVLLVLEWAQAMAWIEDYEGAEAVLLEGLAYHPESVSLRVELARIYFFTDRLEEAGDLLSAMSETELASVGAVSLRDDVLAALTPPPDPDVEPPPPPTLLEQAVAAREAGELTRAAQLFEEALEDDPDDPDTWKAYADFLQYEVEDFEGALDALKEVERLGDEPDPDLQYRMALLEVWTGKTEEARSRLLRLLVLLDAQVVDSVSRADVQSVLGDLHRWNGERLPAVDRYQLALIEEPDHVRALEGLAVLQADVDRMMVEVEEPRMGGIANSLADTDDFRRLDLGGEWHGLHEDWVWGTRSGARLLEGHDLTGTNGNRRGLFADLEGGRWWRWGTIRTGASFGVQTLRGSNLDLSAGLTARLVGASGSRTDLGIDHGPAYGLTNTLQSAFANVQADRFTASHAQPLGETWSAAVNGEAASLNHVGVAGAGRNLRVAAGVSVGRTLSRRLSLGISARALRFGDAAPDVAGQGLYWDPNASLSIGPYAQYRQPLTTWWEFNARLNPGFAWIDERGAPKSEAVPDLSASLGLAREGARYRTKIDFFFGQGRFSGYRSFGLNLSFSARGWFGRAGSIEENQ